MFLAVLLGVLPDLSASTGEVFVFKSIKLWNLDILFRGEDPSTNRYCMSVSEGVSHKKV